MQILSFIERTPLSDIQDPFGNRFMRHKNIFSWTIGKCLAAMSLTWNIEHTLIEFEMWSIHISTQKDSHSSYAIHRAPRLGILWKDTLPLFIRTRIEVTQNWTAPEYESAAIVNQSGELMLRDRHSTTTTIEREMFCWQWGNRQKCFTSSTHTLGDQIVSDEAWIHYQASCFCW